MQLDLAGMSADEAYRWLTATVTPRPIAWVTSVSSAGVVNLAPFSFFQVICDQPPTLMVNVGLNPGGRLKDTLVNARETGQMVWQYNLGASAPGALTLADGRIYVGSVNRYLTCLSAEDGTELWRSPQYGGWVWGEALVVGDGIYFGSLDGVMHALNTADGSQRWQDVKLDGAIRAGPALSGEMLVVGTESGYVYTLDLADGAKSLIFGDREDEKLGAVLSTPIVVGDMIYVSTAAANIAALDLTKRDPMVWVYPPTENK